MIITTTGFFNTGSSAITHLLSEYSSIGNVDDVYELRFLYDPDALSDLAYHLLENPHRQNTSYAIKRFLKYVDFNTNPLINHHYERIFCGNFKKLSYEYVNNISKFQYNSNSHVDTFGKSSFYIFINRIYQYFIRLFIRSGIKNCFPNTLISCNEKQYAGIFDSDLFYKITRMYISNLFLYIKNNRGNILIDQFLPPSDFNRYLKFIPNDEKIVVFVVDRDPRDIYVLSKYFINSNIIPLDDANKFCDWFLWTRGQSTLKPDPINVHRIQFEDLVYNYNATVKNIEEICSLNSNDHVDKMKNLCIDKSINNTQVWYRFPKSKEEIVTIEHRLKKYLYNFDKYDKKPIYNKDNLFDC